LRFPSRPRFEARREMMPGFPEHDSPPIGIAHISNVRAGWDAKEPGNLDAILTVFA
jgi:hypothetical protein